MKTPPNNNSVPRTHSHSLHTPTLTSHTHTHNEGRRNSLGLNPAAASLPQAKINALVCINLFSACAKIHQHEFVQTKAFGCRDTGLHARTENYSTELAEAGQAGDWWIIPLTYPGRLARYQHSVLFEAILSEKKLALKWGEAEWL